MISFHSPGHLLKGGAALVALLSAALLTGCSAGSGRPTLSGKVTLNGNPVTGGTIELYPADGKGTPYPIVIGPEGTYSVSGVPTGSMKVAIKTEHLNRPSGYGYKPEAHREKGGPPPDAPLPKDTSATRGKYVPLPPRYADPKTSGLTLTVEKGKQTKDFELTK